MSKAAQGSIEGQGNDFTGRFNVEGRPKKFAGSLSQRVAHFKSTTATLAYDNVNDLSGAYELTFSNGVPSFVGEDKLVFNLKNEDDVTLNISGKLVASIDDRQTVMGNGKWSDDNE